MTKKIFISAAEVSGDKHAASLASALKKQCLSLELVGMGSTHCKEAGINVMLDVSAFSTVGLIEPIKYLPKLIWAMKQWERLIEKEKPDAIVVIDAQGFHMRVLQKIKHFNIPAIYYISPQEWQWGTAENGKKVLQCVKKICAIFPEEAQFYNDLGGDATYVGHPTIDQVNTHHCSKDTLNIQIDNKENKPIFSIFPGSRADEVKRLLPVFCEVATYMDQTLQAKVVMSCATMQLKKLITDYCTQNNVSITLFEGKSLHLMQHTQLSLVTSGTVTFEHALYGIPTVVAYQFNPVTFWIANTFFKKQIARIKHMALANLIKDKEMYPEFLQKAVTKTALIAKLEALWNGNEREGMLADLASFKRLRNQQKAAEKAAKLVLEQI